jgi:4-hydroxybenzoate polyprenyltransferase
MKYLQLIRPKQWVKQGFVFIPLLSLGSKFSLADFWQGVIAMVIFTATASSVYIYNDFSDLESDRKDLFRSLRPLASGQVKPKNAFLLALGLLGSSLVACFFLSNSSESSLGLILVYLFINFTYSRFNLKRHNILGISLVGAGFPIRFAFGCSFVGIPYSYWAITMLMLLALFMLSIKRYQLTLRNAPSENDSDHEFWLIAAITFAAFFSASYAGFVSSPTTQRVWGSTALLVSSIPVALGIVRFIELGTDRKRINAGDATEAVVRDFPILTLGAIYVLIMLLGNISIH